MIRTEDKPFGYDDNTKRLLASVCYVFDETENRLAPHGGAADGETYRAKCAVVHLMATKLSRTKIQIAKALGYKTTSCITKMLIDGCCMAASDRDFQNKLRIAYQEALERAQSALQSQTGIAPSYPAKFPNTRHGANAWRFDGPQV